MKVLLYKANIAKKTMLLELGIAEIHRTAFHLHFRQIVFERFLVLAEKLSPKPKPTFLLTRSITRSFTYLLPLSHTLSARTQRVIRNADQSELDQHGGSDFNRNCGGYTGCLRYCF